MRRKRFTTLSCLFVWGVKVDAVQRRSLIGYQQKEKRGSAKGKGDDVKRRGYVLDESIMHAMQGLLCSCTGLSHFVSSWVFKISETFA